MLLALLTFDLLFFSRTPLIFYDHYQVDIVILEGGTN
jgi:hypothetical protein